MQNCFNQEIDFDIAQLANANINNKNFIEYKGKLISGYSFIEKEKSLNEILCCMTVYNEPAAAILVSLYSLWKNVLMISHVNNGLAKAISVIIIADGANKLSASSIQLFKKLGLLNSEIISSEIDFIITENKLNQLSFTPLINELYDNYDENSCWVDILNDTSQTLERDPFNTYNDIHIKLNVKLCIKVENKGKLDSHWWFFNILCKSILPKYCIQMDAGTSPKCNAIWDLYNHFEINPKAGAAASMVLINKIQKASNWLHMWQIGDFIYQRLFCWPAELLVGYLTAIPGQFCFIRTEAFLGNSKSPIEVHSNEETKTPADYYFRGLNNLDPFQSNMFLAEDRILGFEIMTAKDSDWNLTYVTSAIAITDPCNSLSELLQQRRRWNNSEFMCNLWLMLKLKRFTQNKKTILNKLQTIITIPTFLLNGIFVFLLPAFLFCVTNIFNETCLNKTSHYLVSYFFSTLYITAIALYFVQLVIFINSRFKKAVTNIFYLNTGIQFIILASMLTFIIANKFSIGNSFLCAAIVFFELIVGLILSALASKKIVKDYLKVSLFFFLIRPIMLLQIRTYSFSNIHDTSWGTKGLLKKNAFQNTSFERKITANKFRNFFIVLWLAVNAVLTFIIYFMSLQSKILTFNIVLFFIASYTLLKVMGGFKVFLNRRSI